MLHIVLLKQHLFISVVTPIIFVTQVKKLGFIQDNTLGNFIASTHSLYLCLLSRDVSNANNIDSSVRT